jgi:hypothetical protein
MHARGRIHTRAHNGSAMRKRAALVVAMVVSQTWPAGTMYAGAARGAV